MSTVMPSSAYVMSTSAYATDAPMMTAHISSTESLMQLLAHAKATIESNVTAARACIDQATELLRPGLSNDRVRTVGRLTTHGGLPLWQAKRVASYIEDNLASSIHIEELADVVQLSTSRFFRLFKQSFGVTPHIYIAQQRVRRAQQLMMGSPESLAQIALDCGMCDQAHFTRVFRRVVGSTPSAWRRQFMGSVL